MHRRHSLPEDFETCQRSTGARAPQDVRQTAPLLLLKELIKDDFERQQAVF
jgi:hypothetical protein